MSKQVLVAATRAIKTVYDEGDSYIDVDRLYKWDDTEQISFTIDRFKRGTVTHWIPLPEMPKEQ